MLLMDYQHNHQDLENQNSEDLRMGWRPDDLLNPQEAAKYVAWLWKKPFTVGGLRSLRLRRGLEPALKTPNCSWWRRSQLDQIERPKEIGTGKSPR